MKALRPLLLAVLAGLTFLLATAATAEPLFVIADTGDCETDGAARVAAALQAQPDWREALLVEVGDLAYPVATRVRLLECHEPHFAGFRRVAAPGNHDWRDPGAAGFFSIFPGPVPRVVALAGPWRLLLLDSNLKNAAGRWQLDWLERTLAAGSGQCLIAAWHHPRWSSGKHGDDDEVAPLWTRVAGKAVFTLHGHDHHFEALPALDAAGNISPAGTPSFIAGIGGAKLYPPGDTPRSTRAVYGTWGFLRIDLEGSAYRWRAIAVDGRELDRGEGQCRAL